MLSAALIAQEGAAAAELMGGRNRGNVDMRLYPAITATIAVVVIAGCAGKEGNRPASANIEKAQPVTLTSAQLEAIQGGVKQMIANPGSARFSAATAVTLPGQPGVHVCGHVKVKGGSEGGSGDLPYYLELRDKEGQPAAERGQVGTDEAKRSKITFMCRHHGSG